MIDLRARYPKLPIYARWPCVNLPDGWVRIQGEVFRNALAGATSAQAKSGSIVDAAFQQQGVPGQEASYAVVTVFLTPNQVSEAKMEETIGMIEGIRTRGIKPKQADLGVTATLDSLLDLKPGSARFDRAKRVFVWKLETAIGGQPRVQTTHGFFGRSSIVQLNVLRPTNQPSDQRGEVLGKLVQVRSGVRIQGHVGAEALRIQ